MNVGRHSPSPSSSTTTRIVTPRPFYRSQVTPDPFDNSNHNRREVDQPQRRYSAHHINGKMQSFKPTEKIIYCMLSVFSYSTSPLAVLTIRDGFFVEDLFVL